ncbi:MAG: ATP-binding protein [Thermovenabulum sp.]
MCPTGALTQKGFNVPQVDEDKCIKCMKCVSYCPTGAITLKKKVNVK